MAAVSAPQASSALTPPSSSHGEQNSWNYSVPAQSDAASLQAAEPNRAPLSPTNGHGLGHVTSSTELSQRRSDLPHAPRSAENGYLAPARVNALNRKDSSLSETGSAADSLLDLYGPNRSGINGLEYTGGNAVRSESLEEEEEDQERSRWIHRDKLARIESQELQAAGIILPQARAASKSSWREHSRDQLGNGTLGEQAQKRQRVGSLATEEGEEPESIAWDLRTAEEASQDQGDYYQDISGGVKGVSRIPVLKTSPLPIPLQHLERDTPMRRTQGGASVADDDSISYPKLRGRSQSVKAQEAAATATTLTPAKRVLSENSPTKKAPGRKGSMVTNRAASAQRPKTRSGSTTINSTARPQTRSGDLGPSTSISKRPEGDPPWLATMFKPDPRLPPDQQLLPTVARRLRQEQWEKEGKFGNTYDTDFRPLNDEQYPRSPEPPPKSPELPVPSADAEPEAAAEIEAEAEKKSESGPESEWPLRVSKNPALSPGRPGTAGTGSYSTMPRVHTGGTAANMDAGPLTSPQPPIRTPDPAEESKKSGCGCCIIM
ncbi:hypothetical protein PZA11_002105 [Diplocarpon coronariae]|uniref:TeaA receptor TeaR n=1 Tax=Diplocarpon coronariae TaxID=2795749 RepID=A0A218Z5M8_9HELO|nr:hypothetical protein B2J93_7375 [Marssonina coronariae]